VILGNAHQQNNGENDNVVNAVVVIMIEWFSKTDAWEATIPEEKRKTFRVDEEVFETDDPRWLAHRRTLDALFEAESDAECALADIVPTTTAGVCAILKYGVEVEERGSRWNTLVDPDDESIFHRRIGRSWHYFVNRNIVTCLEGMGALKCTAGGGA
jgi:hypothetical protein